MQTENGKNADVVLDCRVGIGAEGLAIARADTVRRLAILKAASL